MTGGFTWSGGSMGMHSIGRGMSYGESFGSGEGCSSGMLVFRKFGWFCIVAIVRICRGRWTRFGRFIVGSLFVFKGNFISGYNLGINLLFARIRLNNGKMYLFVILSLKANFCCFFFTFYGVT